MEAPAISPLLWTLLILWGVITAAWIIMLIYRGTLESREDDQLFLDAAEEHMASEQRVLVARLTRLGKPILALGVGSGALLVITAAVWLWQAFRSF
jgi:hypothetical protein